MNDKITYAVFWKTKLDPDKWQCYWASIETREYAREIAKIALKNPRSIAVRVVEHIETFKPVDEWRKNEWNE